MASSVDVRAAGLIIIRRISSQIEYLLMQTSYGHHHWTPPKGHVDPGEDDLQTAIRETQEESGLSQSQYTILMDFKKQLHYKVKGHTKVVTYWLAELKNIETPVIMSSEHQDYKWLPVGAAKKLSRYLQMNNLLDECEDFLNR